MLYANGCRSGALLLIVILVIAFSQRADSLGARYISSETLDVISFGAKGDGRVDDTAAFQASLSASVGKTLRIPKPSLKYLVGPLSIPSETRILLDAGTIIEARPRVAAEQSLISLSDASNVTIIGHGAVFQMPRSEYTTGEHRHCLAIRGGSDIYIEGIACNGSGGDGFYIGTGRSSPLRVKLERVTASRNRRQGLSIISGTDIVVNDSSFVDTAGADPECGIDIEPNQAWEALKGIRLSNIRTANNAGCGISVSLSRLNRGSEPVDVKITNFRDELSPKVGIRAQCNWDEPRAGALGEILIDGATIGSAGFFGVYLKGWQQSCPSITFRDLAIHNSNRLATKNKAAVVLYRDHGGTEKLGNVHFVRPVITDTNPETRLDDYFLFVDATGKGYTNVTIQDPKLSGARHKYKGSSRKMRPGSDEPSLRPLYSAVAGASSHSRLTVPCAR